MSIRAQEEYFCPIDVTLGSVDGMEPCHRRDAIDHTESALGVPQQGWDACTGGQGTEP